MKTMFISFEFQMTRRKVDFVEVTILLIYNLLINLNKKTKKWIVGPH